MMRTFRLIRDVDVTGVSGTGAVAEGVEFSDGIVALRWLSEFPTSVVFHDRGMDSVDAVHGHGGATRVEFDELISAAQTREVRDLQRRIFELTTCKSCRWTTKDGGLTATVGADEYPCPGCLEPTFSMQILCELIEERRELVEERDRLRHALIRKAQEPKTPEQRSEWGRWDNRPEAGV